MDERGHAIVAGAGMAGLLAAYVLAERYERVTIVEPDALPEGAEHRRGVPQSGHAHLLLARGANALEELMPGLRADLRAAGARVFPAGLGPDSGMRVFSAAGALAETTFDRQELVGVSRPLLEAEVRRRVRARGNVTVLAGSKVVGLTTAGAGRNVTGAILREAGPGTAGPERRMVAELVVDASGRHSSAPGWLTAAGYPDVPETTVEPRVGYASRWYRRPPDPTGNWWGLLIHPRPGVNDRGATLLPVENGLCTVTLGGVGGHYPPTDEDGFLRWALDLTDRSMYDAIVESEPVSEIRAYRSPTSRLRHFDRLPRWPEGLLVVGDAVCAFNPVYGQGMSVSALEALTLRAELAGPRHGVEDRFRRRVAHVVAAPWDVASGEDRRWDPAAGTALTRAADALRRRYVGAAQAAATADPAVANAFGKVMLMLAEPGSLLRPSVAARVARHRVRRTRTQDSVPDHRTAHVGGGSR